MIDFVKVHFKKTWKIFFLMTFICFSVSIAYSSEKHQDVVYLKNGSIIRGTLIELIIGKTMKIKTKDGSIFVYNLDEVEKITKEPTFRDKSDNNDSYSNNSTFANNSNSLGSSELIFHPLGFLQFGPILQYDIFLGKSLYIGPHLRFSYFGVLYHYLIEMNKINPSALAFGLNIKKLFGNKRNKFYAGLITEYGGADGEAYSSYYNGIVSAAVSYLTLMLNGGYRFRSNSGFFINTGVISGIVQELDNFPFKERTYPIIMFDLSIGWEF